MTTSPALPSALMLEGAIREGRDALASGDLEGALRTFDDALRLRPAYAPAWRAKGQALRMTGDAEGSLACYVESLQREPDDASGWFGLALTLHALGRREEEVEAYREAVRRDPLHTGAWVNLAAVLHEARRYNEALESSDEILRVRPDLATAWNNRGAALLRLKRFEEAVEAFDEALALDPTNADAMANREIALGRLDRSEEHPNAYTFPRTASLPARLEARALSSLGYPAVDAWRRTRSEEPEDYAALGTGLLDAGQPLPALAAFRKSEALGGGAVARLGRLVATEGVRSSDRKEEATAAVSAYPDSVRLAASAARMLADAGDHEAASSVLSVALDEDPELLWFWRWKGTLDLRRGAFDDAIEAFRQSLAEEPEDAQTLANLAAALHRAGRDEEALESCDAALAADPSLTAAWNNKAVALHALGRADEAGRACRRAVRGGHLPSLRNQARLEESRGNVRAALRANERILEKVPGDAAATSGRRRALGHLGQRARARSERLIARLVKIPGVKRATARRVLSSGFDTPAKIRAATPRRLQKATGITNAQARAICKAFS